MAGTYNELLAMQGIEVLMPSGYVEVFLGIRILYARGRAHEEKEALVDVVDSSKLGVLRKLTKAGQGYRPPMLLRVRRPVSVNGYDALGCDPQVSRVILNAHR